MKKFVAAVLILSVLLTTVALADNLLIVAVSGQTNIRRGPGLNYGILDVLHRGEALYFAGSTSYDNRGDRKSTRLWYSVYFRGGIAWVSSRYTDVFYD